MKKSYHVRTLSSSVHEETSRTPPSRLYSFAPGVERMNGECVAMMNWQP